MLIACLILRMRLQVRETLQAFNEMLGAITMDMKAMASNYKECAHVNRQWQKLVSKQPSEDEGK